MICPLCQATKLLTVIETPRWKIRACEACTNAWTDPAPGTIDYANANFHQHTVGTTPQQKTIQDLPTQWQQSLAMQVALLKKHLPPTASILEIGCGEGILLNELQRASFHTTGIEASQSASAAARNAGLNVLTGYFPHEKVSDTFDAIILSHVLEHLEKPADILQRIAAALNPRGRLLLVQTHWLGLMPQRYAEKWYAWVPDQHFWHFTPKGLETLASPLHLTKEALEYSSLVHTRPDGSLNQFSTIALTTQGGAGGDQFHLLLRKEH